MEFIWPYGGEGTCTGEHGVGTGKMKVLVRYSKSSLHTILILLKYLTKTIAYFNHAFKNGIKCVWFPIVNVHIFILFSVSGEGTWNRGVEDYEKDKSCFRSKWHHESREAHSSSCLFLGVYDGRL